MGYIPAFLALAAFVFLWGMVVHQSLSASQKQIIALKKFVREEITGHLALIDQYLSASRNSAIREISGSEAYRQYVAAIRQELHHELNVESKVVFLHQKLVPLLEQASGRDKTVAGFLQQLAGHYDSLTKAYQKLRRNTRDYNKRVSTKPVQFLALAFGFKPYPLPPAGAQTP